MERIPSGYAIRHFGELMERASHGEDIIVTRYGRDYALITRPPVPTEEAPESPSRE